MSETSAKGEPTPAAGDQARVTVSVGVPPGTAFEIFTQEIDSWWRRGPRFRQAGVSRGFIRIEAGVGGRIFESFEAAGATQVVQVGSVLVWEPARRLVFSWRNVNFAAHESTEVEVLFAAAGQGTLVTVLHRGWSSLPAAHPARHGLNGAEFSRMIGLWWGDLLTSLRQHAGRRAASPQP
jgi:uncharacterized protein YndB with AHSA1/START domain